MGVRHLLPFNVQFKLHVNLVKSTTIGRTSNITAVIIGVLDNKVFNVIYYIIYYITDIISGHLLFITCSCYE